MKKGIKEIIERWNLLNPKWVTPDEAMFISEYMELHPDKKLNWALKKKLWFKYRTRRVKSDS